ncbi:anaerobic ribonucleoside-triphosphate reductase [Zhaonella formicivorans]|uniref:anaerobic ribonucleoside-triphosphate reductase n=1 Tax=Zhaonella formicivorans TaxID=2528593 RepID=UPI0010F2BD4C|nr:anaerobic ribonucleoside-triphosphate reductase [Zhaonella formicivorans]
MVIETAGIKLTADEKAEVVKQAQAMAASKGEQVAKIKAWMDSEGFLCFQPFFKREIRRVRRITGYFSEIKNFNDAKKAELRDRVAHV